MQYRTLCYSKESQYSVGYMLTDKEFPADI